MKKLALAAVAAALATVTLAPAADAANWRHRGWNHGGWHGGWNHRGWNHGWRHGGWRYHNGWRGGWRGGYWGGPRIVIAGPVYGDYCFIRKVRHHDRYGNAYIKRVRVCR